MGQTLVIHPGPLGDVLLAIPALRALRRRHGRELVLAAQSSIGELLHMLGVVDVRVRFDLLGLNRLFVDGPLDPPAEMLSTADRLVCWFGSKDPTFAKRLTELVPGAVVAPPWTPDVLVWEHLLETLGEDVPGADRDPVGLPARLVAEGRRALEAAGWDGSLPLVIVHPGASGTVKRWSPVGYAQLIEATQARVPVTIVVHEGPADHEPVRALRLRLPASVGVLDNPTLPVLASALAHARAFVGNDSGVSHLAAAVGAPSLVLFTTGMRAWEPWSRRARTLVVSTVGLYREDVEAASAALARLVT
jgi:ADP-heptose:LPS heptosyltransferase